MCFYLSFIMLVKLIIQSYFIPLLYPNILKDFFIVDIFQFHNIKYKDIKSDKYIKIEFYILIFLFFMMIYSYFRTTYTNPGEIPNDELWNMTVPDNFPSDMQSELIALMVEKRERYLETNKNILYRGTQFSDSTFSTSTFKLNQIFIKMMMKYIM